VLREYLKNGGFLEKGEAQNLQNLVGAALEPEFFLDDGYQNVDADGNPDLRLHGILRSTVEGFDTQVLLDPFEEQFHLPAALVKFGDRQRVQDKVVGDKDQAFSRFGIDILDASEESRILAGRFGSRENDTLIAAQSGVLVDGSFGSTAALEVFLRAGDEEGHVGLKDIEAGEIDVASVHNVERAGFDRKVVEGFDIVHFPAGNMDKTRDVAAQVDERMQLDGSLAPAKARPREEGQTQIDRCGIESVDCFLQSDAQGVAGIELPGTSNEDSGEVGVDAPVAVLVGFGQGVARDVAANACVIQFGFQRVQTDFDVAQAGAVGQLRKGHAQKLIEAGKPAGAIVASVLADTAVEVASGEEGDELGEEVLPGVHCQVLSTLRRGKDYQNRADQVEIDARTKPS
jgi:hypothetical protein